MNSRGNQMIFIDNNQDKKRGIVLNIKQEAESISTLVVY